MHFALNNSFWLCVSLLDVVWFLVVGLGRGPRLENKFCLPGEHVRVWPLGPRFFFPRVRTPCGHGAQVIVEGREEQTDGGERNEGPKTKHPSPQAETPPSCSLPSTLGETCETKTSGN